MPFVQATNVHVHVLIPVWDARMFAGAAIVKINARKSPTLLNQRKLTPPPQSWTIRHYLLTLMKMIRNLIQSLILSDHNTFID